MTTTEASPTGAAQARSGPRRRIVMLLENNPYPQDVRVRQEAESLTAAGHSVTVIAPNGGGQAKREEIGGVTARRFFLPEGSGSVGALLLEYVIAHVQLFARGLAELIRGAEVIHLHNPPDTLFPIGLVARAMGRRVVFDHHDLFPELLGHKLGDAGWAVAIGTLAQRASFRTANAVLVTNRSQAELAMASDSGVAPRLSIVRNGPKGATLASAAPARGGILRDPRLVFVGELDSQDGVLDLPLILAESGLEDARLTVVGDGALRGELENQFAARGMAERVTFTGQVEHARVPELIAGADICIDPAPCTELNHRSTMIKITEYLAARRPVVAFGLRETRFSAGDAALYAPCGDRTGFARLIAELAGDPDRRASLSDLAAERAADLVWERSEEELIDAYDRI